MASPVPIMGIYARKPTEMIFPARMFSLVKQKKRLDLKVFNRISQTIKKTVNFKCYSESNCTCNTVFR